MSAKEAEEMSRCASCGIDGGDEIKLKDCSACHLVKYCSVKCQNDHRQTHKKDCKKRAAELRDELLLKQPESTHLGDCLLCCLPLPVDDKKVYAMACCSKLICNGCDHANRKREIRGRFQHKCPFCREAVPKTEEEFNKQWTKRIEANDPVAMQEMGTKRHKEGDYKAAIEYFTGAAASGDAEAHFQLSLLYQNGQGVEKDKKKELHHLTEAAIAGHPTARYNLGCLEGMNGKADRGVKHYIIAAKLGHDDSLASLTKACKVGFVSKKDYAAALRGHQAAIEATKSPQREVAAEYAMALRERKEGD